MALGDLVNGEALIRSRKTANGAALALIPLAWLNMQLFLSSFLRLSLLTLEGLTSPHDCLLCGATKIPCWQPCSVGVITSLPTRRAGTSLIGMAHTLGMFLLL